MKKILLALLLLASIYSTAQETKPIKKQKKPKKDKTEQEYRPFKSAGTWFMIGGSSLILSAGSRLAGNYINPPSITQFSNVNDYNHQYDKWEKKQEIFNGIFYGGIMLSGVSILFGASDLLNADEKKISDKMTLKYKAGPAGASICLNF